MIKKIIIGVGIFLVVALLGCFIFYNVQIGAVGKDEVVVFKIESGTPSTKIIKNLKDADLIKSELVAKIYAYLNNKISFQAGNYELNKNMNLEEIFNKFIKGDVLKDSITLQFIEGKRLIDYVSLISENFNMDKQEILNTLSDETYLKELINKYWFITDEILNGDLYYNLEGYLYPDKYEFAKDASIKDIVTKLLNNLQNKIEPYKETIENNKYSFHELLTLASVVELEAATPEDRKTVAGVFYNKLSIHDSLGSDVTTYYGAKKTFKDDLLQAEIDTCNAYNTRGTCLMGKLPVGPICSPSIVSISSAIEPEDTEYMYFVADKNKKLYFARNNVEHIQNKNKLISEGLWYTYE